MNTSNIPYVDRPSIDSTNRFYVDGTNQNLVDALKYLSNVVEFNDLLDDSTEGFPIPKRKANEMIEFIKGFLWCYERIPESQKI